MSNKLDSSHPFRASINHKTEKAPAPAAPIEAPQVDLPPSTGGSKLLERANAEFKTEQRDLNNLNKQAGVFKKRAKLLGTALAATAGFYGFLAIYDLIYAPPSNIDTLHAMQSSFDEGAYSGTRDVDEARESVSIFSRLFCKGGRRSTFCN